MYLCMRLYVCASFMGPLTWNNLPHKPGSELVILSRKVQRGVDSFERGSFSSFSLDGGGYYWWVFLEDALCRFSFMLWVSVCKKYTYTCPYVCLFMWNIYRWNEVKHMHMEWGQIYAYGMWSNICIWNVVKYMHMECGQIYAYGMRSNICSWNEVKYILKDKVKCMHMEWGHICVWNVVKHMLVEYMHMEWRVLYSYLENCWSHLWCLVQGGL